MWNGKIDDIPEGWQLCDGANGAPDLRDNFSVGAGGGYKEGSTGGSIHHKLQISNLPSHKHNKNIDEEGEIPIREENLEPGASSTMVVSVQTVKAPTEKCSVATCNDFPRCVQFNYRGHSKPIPEPKSVYTLSRVI